MRDPGSDTQITSPKRGSGAQLWWLDPAWTPRWSDEETTVQRRICLIAIGFFLLLYVPEMWILNHFGLDHHLNAIIGIFSAVPLAL